MLSYYLYIYSTLNIKDEQVLCIVLKYSTDEYCSGIGVQEELYNMNTEIKLIIIKQAPGNYCTSLYSLLP